MKKIPLSFFLIIAFTCGVKAQDTTVSRVESGQLLLDLIMPGIVYEVGVGHESTLAFKGGIGLSSYDEDLFHPNELKLGYNFIGAYRYYYNFNRRDQKGKNTTFNSANYIGLHTSLSKSFNPRYEDEVAAFYAGPVWGFQRTYNGRINLRLALGLGYTNTAGGELSAIGDFGFGIRLGQ